MSIYLEEIIEKVSDIFQRAKWETENQLKISPADYKFITDISKKTSQGKQISTKQAEVAVRILRKYVETLPGRDNFHWTEEELRSSITAPIFRQVPYQSVPIRREARYIGNRKIALRSKYSPQIVKGIRNTLDKMCLRSIGSRNRTNHIHNNKQYDFPRFNKKHKLWIIEVTENNLDIVMRCIKKLNIEFDDSVVQFFMDCSNSTNEQTTIESIDNEIEIVVQNDEFLALWLDDEFKEKRSV